MKDIVIIEDDAALNHGIALALRRDDLRFHQCFRLGDFKASEKADLIILDVNLPDGNGFDFLKELRRTSNKRLFPISFSIRSFCGSKN